MRQAAEQPLISPEGYRVATHTIRRQHESTNFPELRGAICSAFRAVICERDQRLSLLFLQLSDVWHRFYLDAGLLFWEEGSCPEPEDDVLEGERYTELGEALRVVNVAVGEIEMHDSQLTLQFENGARLVLRNRVQGDGTEVVELVPGKS
jgi:hypothetical protein